MTFSFFLEVAAMDSQSWAKRSMAEDKYRMETMQGFAGRNLALAWPRGFPQNDRA
jgi:hypothetical protein